MAAIQAGVPVRLRDASMPQVGKGMKAVAEVVRERVRRRSATRRKLPHVLTRLTHIGAPIVVARRMGLPRHTSCPQS